MGKYAEWCNTLTKAVEHDLQNKIYKEFMMALGDYDAVQENIQPDLLDTALKEVAADINRTVEDAIDSMDLSYHRDNKKTNS